jgi:hypothetical protein
MRGPRRALTIDFGIRTAPSKVGKSNPMVRTIVDARGRSPMCRQSSRPSLGGEAGGSLPRLRLLIFSSTVQGGGNRRSIIFLYCHPNCHPTPYHAVAAIIVLRFAWAPLRVLPSQAEEDCATQSICAGWRYRTFVFREVRLPNAALILVVDPACSANSRRRFGAAASATAEAAM